MDNIKENMKNIYAEVWEMFKYLNSEDLNKIPKNILKEINENKNENHTFKYNPNICLEEQNIMEDTKNYFSILYYKYCCSNNEKENIIKHWMKKPGL